jgi:hypothetical protein
VMVAAGSTVALDQVLVRIEATDATSA